MTLANQAFNTVGNGVDQQRAAVFETFDYEKFSFLNENRELAQGHLKSLKDSMKNEALLSPILVNERKEIIDGQHRFAARKELGLPIPYIICHNYRLREVQILNAHSKTWSVTDYLESYATMGYSDYIALNTLKTEFQFLNLTILICLSLDLNGKFNYTPLQNFKEGRFEMKAFNKTKQICKEVEEMKEYWAPATKTYFILAYKQAREIDGFNTNYFLHKVRNSTRQLEDCANIDQFRHMIHDVYNYRSKKKVELRPLK